MNLIDAVMRVIPLKIIHSAMLLSILCFTAGASLARADSTTQCFTPSSSFNSALDAVITASNTYNPLSIREDREFMGTVLQKKGEQDRFIYTASAGEVKGDRINITVKIPEDYKIVAFWHTHGAAHWSRVYFSHMDTKVANQWQVPFYLADHSGELKVFNPGDRTYSQRRKQASGLGNIKRYGKGSMVRNPVTGDRILVATQNHKTSSMPGTC